MITFLLLIQLQRANSTTPLTKRRMRRNPADTMLKWLISSCRLDVVYLFIAKFVLNYIANVKSPWHVS